jgi:hypothetical protein
VFRGFGDEFEQDGERGEVGECGEEGEGVLVVWIEGGYSDWNVYKLYEFNRVLSLFTLLF